MFSTLLKVFGPLLHPIGLLWLACIGGAIYLFRKKEKRGAYVLAGLALTISLIGSRVSLWLLKSIERPYMTQTLATIPEADVMVVLGGGVQYSDLDMLEIQLNSASDRVLTAVELLRLRKAPVLVLGGGGFLSAPPDKGESETVKRWLQSWGVVSAPIHTLGICVNTRQEAMRFAALTKEQGWKRVLLVTSAYQLTRARDTFLKAGVEVIPVGCDFQARGESYGGWTNPFPEPAGFEHLNYYIHEKVGWIVYRLRGWIGKPAEILNGSTPPPPTNSPPPKVP